jgi:hypothetical protein
MNSFVNSLAVIASLTLAAASFAQTAPTAPTAANAKTAATTAASTAAAPAVTSASNAANSAASTAKTKAKVAAAGGSADKVWLNTKSNVYHCFGTKSYGTTKVGEYLSEADAKAKGARADHGKACSK